LAFGDFGSEEGKEFLLPLVPLASTFGSEGKEGLLQLWLKGELAAGAS